MIKKCLIRWKWRRLRLQIWTKRLNILLKRAAVMNQVTFPLTLKISWGPFFNGAAVMDRKLQKGIIHLQIPYDFHLSANELQAMQQYPLPARHLPYFILYHELSHLLDAFHLIHNQQGGRSRSALLSQQKNRRQTASRTADYRQLSFEQEADDFAYQTYLQQLRKAS